MAIDEKVPLMEVSKAEEALNQPVTEIIERLVRIYCLRF